MQTSDKQQRSASPQILEDREAEAMMKRIRKVEDWCKGREISQKVAFFQGAATGITDEHAARMAYVFRTKTPRPYNTDDEWVAKCEVVMKRLKSAA